MLKKHAVLLSSLMLMGLNQAHAATFTVTLTDDPPPDGCDVNGCSIREAIDAANNTDPAPDAANTIILPASDVHYVLSIPGPDEDENATGDLDVLRYNLIIQGDGADVSIIDANGIDRVLDVVSITDNETPITPNLELQNLGITGGNITGEPTAGGGVHVDSLAGSSLTVENCSIFGNTSNFGGGLAFESLAGDVVESFILIQGSSISGNSSVGEGNGNGGGLAFFTSVSNTINLEMVNTTVSGNEAEANGGGIILLDLSPLTINALAANVTITNNTAAVEGGGVFVSASPNSNTAFSYFNSIIYGNTAPTQSDCSFTPDFGNIVSLNDYSIVGNKADCGATGNELEVDPLLGDLALNIGPVPTLTHALLDGSPAIDLVPTDECIDTNGQALTVDQRGITRPQYVACDAGAYEANCGDGIVQGDEECDAGELNGGDTCTTTCTIPPPVTCGNGEIEVGEQCDDGNNNDFDGCSAICVTEFLEGSGEVFSGCQLNQSASAGNPWIWSSFLGLAFVLLASKRKQA